MKAFSTETVRRGITAGKYPASRASTAPRAPWLIDADEYERQRRQDDEEAARRERLRGVVVAYGDDEFDARMEQEHGRAAMEQLRKIRERHELMQQIAEEVRGDAELRRQFEKLDDDEIIERTAHEIAGRVRREERIRRRAAQILDDDGHS